MNAIICWALLGATSAQPQAQRPSLLVMVVVDQLPADQLERERPNLNRGFKTLVDKGVWFQDARYLGAPTVTSAGHAVLGTGTYGSVNGVGSLWWYERAQAKQVYCVEDDRYPLVERPRNPTEGRAPTRLRSPTLADAVRSMGPSSRVVAISGKDRAAILLGGHQPHHALWLDRGGFTTSEYYAKAVPAWAQPENEQLAKLRQAGFEWTAGAQKHAVGGGLPVEDFTKKLLQSPEGDRATLRLALAAAAAEQLGTRPTPDVLLVGLSGHDYIGHRFGPESPEAIASLRSLDEALADFFSALEARLGAARVLTVVTSDHGGLQVSREQGPRGGALAWTTFDEGLRKELARAHGPGEWLLAWTDAGLYFSDKKKDAVLETAARYFGRQEAFIMVLRRDQPAGWLTSSQGRAYALGTDPSRGGDLVPVLAPYWTYEIGEKGMHGTPYGYDARVPLLVRHPKLTPRRVVRRVDMASLAATLASLLGAPPPGTSDAEVLPELLSAQAEAQR